MCQVYWSNGSASSINQSPADISTSAPPRATGDTEISDETLNSGFEYSFIFLPPSIIDAGSNAVIGIYLLNGIVRCGKNIGINYRTVGKLNKHRS